MRWFLHVIPFRPRTAIPLIIAVLCPNTVSLLEVGVSFEDPSGCSKFLLARPQEVGATVAYPCGTSQVGTRVRTWLGGISVADQGRPSERMKFSIAVV